MLDVRFNTLLSVAKTKNFTHSAEQLSLTQPAVSHHIKQLETEYGIRIFDKNGKNLQLTKAGELLVEYAEHSRVLENAFHVNLRSVLDEPTHFSVGVTTTLAEYILSNILARYCKKHPNITVDVFWSDRRTLIKKLCDYELDWILINYATPEGCREYKLCDDESHIIVSKDHYLANTKSIDFEVLRKEKFILCYKDNLAMQLFNNRLQEINMSVDELNIVVETNSMKVIKSMVAANVGISVLQKVACIQEINEGSIVPLAINNFSMPGEVKFVYRQDFAYPDIFKEMSEIYKNI